MFIHRLIPSLILALTSIAAAAQSVSELPDSAIRMSIDTLAEVTVTAQLSSHRGNEDSYIVTAQMLEGTHIAGDILAKLPGVFYNPIDRSLKYLGSDNVMILVDGTEKDADYIKRLNPKRFARIEIDNHPVGKYQDYDAVINLFSKKSYAGFDGTLDGDATFMTADHNGRGHPLSIGRAGFDFTFTREKFNISLNTKYRYTHLATPMAFEKNFLLNGYSEAVTMPARKDPNNLWTENVGNIDLWADYSFNNNHRLTIGLQYAPMSNFTTQHTRLITSHDGASPIATDNLDKTDIPFRSQITATAQYHGTVSGWRLAGEVGYSEFSLKYHHTIERPSFSLDDNRRNHAGYWWTGASASKYFFDRKLSLSFFDYALWLGYRERRAGTDITLSHYTTFRNRGGVSAIFSPSQSLSISAGVGLNTTRLSQLGIVRTHNTPRLNLGVSWGRRNFLARFNYTASTDFVPQSYLQDYTSQTDSLIFQSGNPALSPTLNHKFNLTTIIMNHLTLSGEYTISSNKIFDIAEAGFNPGPFVDYKFHNGKAWSWKVNATYSRQMKSISFAATVSLSGSKARLGQYELSRTTPAYDFFVAYSNSRHAFSIYLSGLLNSFYDVQPQQLTWSRHDTYGLTLQKYFFNSKLMVYLYWCSPLHLFKDNRRTSITSPAYNMTQIQDDARQYDNSFRIGLSWNFNGGQKTRKFSRATESVTI